MNFVVFAVIVLVILYAYKESYSELPINPDTGLIDAVPTKNDPFMNNMNPVLKRLNPVYTKEEHDLVESIARDGYMEDTEDYYSYNFTRNFHTEPADDFEAYKDFLGYNRTGPDFYPEKIQYITALND